MKNRIITISREFGSGGRTIGKNTAKELGIPCYDNKLIQKLAEESGFNESYIQEAISELCRGKTLLVIAHRLNTIRGADQILVVSDGTIIQRGNHETLMAEDGVYRNFVAVRQQSRGWMRRKDA